MMIIVFLYDEILNEVNTRLTNVRQEPAAGLFLEDPDHHIDKFTGLITPVVFDWNPLFLQRVFILFKTCGG